MRLKTKAVLSVFVCVLFLLAVCTSCGNSNFFPSQTAIISMTVSPASNVVPPGSTASFAATGTLGNNQTQDVTSQVTWTSSNDSIATVSAGVVTGVALGEVTITASANHITITAPLVVSSMSDITVSPSTWSPTSAGATQQLTATGSDGTPVTDYVAWTSSDTTCAIVSSTGLVTFEGSVADGSCTITATIGSFTGQTNVTGTII